jgi:uncharacterized protein
MGKLHYSNAKPINFECEELDLSKFKENKIYYGQVNVFEDRIGRTVGLPTLIAKGETDGPVFGIIACVHGNEINGIPVIHQLFNELSVEHLSGTIVAVPIINIPGYLSYQREFIDGVDLNRIMPGEATGSPSSVYAHAVMERIISKFNYLIDFHTASFGRENTHYVRADLSNPKIKKIADLQFAQIIVNSKGSIDKEGGTVRTTATDLGIPAITLELGNPQVFQQEIKAKAYKSICNVLKSIGMLEGEIEIPPTPFVCSSSFWMRVQDGGILRVMPDLGEIIEKGEVIATLTDIYGRPDLKYESPERGIVVGRNVNPVVSTGERILHLGRLIT